MSKSAKVAGLVLLVIVTAFVLLLISTEVCGLGYNCLVYNSITSKINYDSVYEPGRHLIGLFSTFITVPKTLITVDFSPMTNLGSLSVRAESLDDLLIDVSFQYSFRKEAIGGILRQDGLPPRPQDLLITQIGSDLRTVGSKFALDDYFQKRAVIGEAMLNTIREKYEDRFIIHFFQLRKITLVSQEVEHNIVLNQVQRQLAVQRGYELQIATIEADTNMRVAEINAEIRVIEAEADATAFSMRKLAEAEAVTILNFAEVDVYLAIKDSLDLTPDELVDYLQLDAVAEKKDAMLLALKHDTLVNIG
ncbi:hypothetical protein RCL1_001600 [Eukaryota sp. TZLM3-RCL]